jgi:endonuclease/exonuclease/phosphatase family metal-dependent hydrolase
LATIHSLQGESLSRKSFRNRVAVLLIAVCAAATAPFIAAAPAQAASVSHTYFSFNMCGNVCNSGGLNVANDTISSIANRNPQPLVVALQEVCRNQYNHMYYSAPLAAYYGYFDVTVPGACSNGEDYGIAILLKTSNFTMHTSAWLPDPYNKEDRKLLCLRTTATGGGTQPLIACNTHIDPHGDTATVQIKYVGDVAKGLWSGHHVMVAGDFNAAPNSSKMAPLYTTAYTPAGTGVFNEADSANLNRNTSGTSSGPYNESTHGSQKIDYIFLSRYDYTNFSGDATSAANSDHDPFWAVVTYV